MLVFIPITAERIKRHYAFYISQLASLLISKLADWQAPIWHKVRVIAFKSGFCYIEELVPSVVSVSAIQAGNVAPDSQALETVYAPFALLKVNRVLRQVPMHNPA